jgi:hypothetical protein
MAIVKKPVSASLRMTSLHGSVQTLSRISPDLSASEISNIRQAINLIRVPGQGMTGGRYTITDELAEA